MKALALIEDRQGATRIKQDKAKATLTKKLKKERRAHQVGPLAAGDRRAHPRDDAVALRLRRGFLQEKRPQDAEDFHDHPFAPRASGKPGEVLRVDKHGILVAASRSVDCCCVRCRLEGKKRMHAAEFARGFNLPVGLVFE